MYSYDEISPYKQKDDLIRHYRTVAPTSLPLKKSEVKQHLNLNVTDISHDEELDLLIESAVSKYEQDTSSAILAQTWVQLFPVFQDGLRISKFPVSTISSIAYFDQAGASQALSSSVYAYDQTAREIRLKPNQSWPDVQDRWDAVTVTFVAGYANDAAIPRQVKHALLLLVGHYFDGDRGDNPAPPTMKTYYNQIANLQRSSYP